MSYAYAFGCKQCAIFSTHVIENSFKIFKLKDEESFLKGMKIL